MNYMRGFDESMKSAFPGSGYSGGGTGLPSGGMGGPGTAGYYGDPRTMSDAQLAAIAGSYGNGTNQGYVQINDTGATTTFGGAGYASPTGYAPGSAQAAQPEQPAYDPYAQYDAGGYGDYSSDAGYSDFGGYGGEEW